MQSGGVKSMKKIVLFLSLFLVGAVVLTAIIPQQKSGIYSLDGPILKPTRDGHPDEGVSLF